MKNYTKKQIIDMLKRNCIYDIGFGDPSDDLRFNGITMQVLDDEEDYNILCDLLEIKESER